MAGKVNDLMIIPSGMCPAHYMIALAWRNNHYDPRHPCEWPGKSIIMDGRTSHAERDLSWTRKNHEQVMITAQICQQGKGPACPPEAEWDKIRSEINKRYIS